MKGGLWLISCTGLRACLESLHPIGLCFPFAREFGEGLAGNGIWVKLCLGMVQVSPECWHQMCNGKSSVSWRLGEQQTEGTHSGISPDKEGRNGSYGAVFEMLVVVSKTAMKRQPCPSVFPQIAFLQVQVKSKGPRGSHVCASEGKGRVVAGEGSGLGSLW